VKREHFRQSAHSLQDLRLPEDRSTAIHPFAQSADDATIHTTYTTTNMYSKHNDNSEKVAQLAGGMLCV